jgi:hypothetical protein
MFLPPVDTVFSTMHSVLFAVCFSTEIVYRIWMKLWNIRIIFTRHVETAARLD